MDRLPAEPAIPPLTSGSPDIGNPAVAGLKEGYEALIKKDYVRGG